MERGQIEKQWYTTHYTEIKDWATRTSQQIWQILWSLVCWLFLWNICVTNDHGYVPLVLNTSRSFPHSWLITGFLTRLTRRVSLVEQELLTLPVHLSSPPVLVGFALLDVEFYMNVLYIVVCPFVLFFWPLCCLFFDIRILITPLVSSS